MKKAFSFVEVLLVIGILLVVSAISYPAFANARREASKAASISNMRQLLALVEIYRSDQSNTSDSGTPSEMGLPQADYFYINMMKAQKLGPPHKGVNRPFHIYMYYPPPERFAQRELVENWVAWTKACGDQTVLIGDFNFTDRPVTEFSGFISKVGLGIRLNGQIARKRGLGDYAGTGWWACPGVEGRTK
jgi:Tfp pilus assembly protein PilE